MLNKKQKQYLRREATSLSPIVMIGKSEITDNIIMAVEENLTAHEMIKISLLQNCGVTPEEVAVEIASETHSEIVCIIGHKVVLYRYNPDNICYPLPKCAK